MASQEDADNDVMFNTTNPFASAPADAITNLLAGFLPPGKDGNAAFTQKAHILLIAIIQVLVALRDAKQALPLTDMLDVAGVNLRQGCLGSGMNVATIHTYMDPAFCVSLVYPLKVSKDAVEECEVVARFVDASLLNAMKFALSSLNYDPDAGEPGKQTAYLDQFGYAKGYIDQVLNKFDKI